MQRYVIGSPKIQIAKTQKKTLAKCEYKPKDLLNYFENDMPIKVFDSLEDANLYADATRLDKRNSPFSISEMHAYPVYKVELKDDIVLTAQQTKKDKTNFVFDSRFQGKLAKDENSKFYLLPEYYEISGNSVVKVLSVIDFYEDKKEIDLLNLEQEHEENYSIKCSIM